MSVLIAPTLISTHGAIWNYPGCWHEMYPHIHMSTWPTCWPNVKLMLCRVTLGHQMPLQGSIGVCLMTCQPDALVDQMASWPEMPLPRATSDWSPSDHRSMWPMSHTLLPDVSAWRMGQVDILCARQSASLPAAIGQPTSQVTRYQPVRLWVGVICGGRRTRSSTTLGPSPGSQHSHWFPLWSDLPEQSHSSDTNELCSLLYTFGTTLNECLQFCIYAT